MNEAPTVLQSLDSGILTLTLNRPDRLNALTPTMGEALMAALDRADADDAVRAVIVTGAGRAFCAGADLSRGDDTFTQARTDASGAVDFSDPSTRDWGGMLTLRIFRCVKPIIAAVNGAAVGVGATMQLAMDIRMAADTARYGFVFARRGIVPEAASSWFLPRIVGISRALEWSYSGRLLSAQEVLDGGLVRSVHAGEDLLGAARAVARDIADNSAPVSIALTRQMMWRMLGADHPMEAHRLDSRAIVSRSSSSDAAEGIASFLEKRQPVFRDRVSADMPEFYPWWNEPTYP